MADTTTPETNTSTPVTPTTAPVAPATKAPVDEPAQEEYLVSSPDSDGVTPVKATSAQDAISKTEESK